MNKRGLGLAGLMASHSLCAMAAPNAPTLTVGPDFAVAGTVDTKPARFQMLPNGSSTLVLNPDAAARFGAKGGWLAVKVKVGPVAIKGNTAVMRFSADGTPSRRRIGWFERPLAPGYDGALGPAAVPQSVVIFQLRAPAAGERQTVLPLVDRGYGGMGTVITVGHQPIFVEWALTKPHNGATAAAGAAIAAAHGGQFTSRPFGEPMAFGVIRPVRRVGLSQPLAIGPLRIDALVTRTSDYGDTSSIPESDADPGEIVVTGRGKSSKAIYSMEIGRDAMQSCSSLTFDKPRRLITLSCR